MNSFLKKIYLYKFFDDFVLIYPFYAVMFSDFGSTPWQIGVLLTVWALTAMILEVPSGALADKYSRKNILFIGQIIRVAGYANWLFFPNFTGFAIGFVLWGIQSALSSGTFEALVYDELKKINKEKFYVKIIGRARSLSLLAILIATALASPAITLGYSFILVLSCLAILISGILVVSLPEVKKVDSTHEIEYIKILQKGLKISFKNKSILRLLIVLLVSLAIPGALEEFWSLFGKEIGLVNYQIAIFLTLINSAEALGSYAAHYFEKINVRILYLTFIFCGVLQIVGSYLFNIPGLTFIVVMMIPLGIVQTIFEGKLQHLASSDIRATISSVKGFLVEIGAIVTNLAIGFSAQANGYSRSFIMLGFIIVFFGLYFLLSVKKRNFAVL